MESKVTVSLGTAHFKEANEKVRAALDDASAVELHDVYAQRYLGCAMPRGKRLEIHGVPGNDMACYMDGGEIEVFGNAQDQIGNTMNDGSVVIHGRVGDAAGYAMRGGRILVRDGCGWRVGIHMKQYEGNAPKSSSAAMPAAFSGNTWPAASSFFWAALALIWPRACTAALSSSSTNLHLKTCLAALCSILSSPKTGMRSCPFSRHTTRRFRGRFLGSSTRPAKASTAFALLLRALTPVCTPTSPSPAAPTLSGAALLLTVRRRLAAFKSAAFTPPSSQRRRLAFLSPCSVLPTSVFLQ